ncbi:MAG: hypothetical protein ACF8QF_08520 [Phycisphaerales bacterium]
MADTPNPDQRPENAPPSDGVVDRRSGIDRRDRPGASSGSGLERRRGPGRRRSDFAKAAEEGELTTEQFNFVAAIDAFKKANDKTFPTWTDVLEVIRLLGYRKTCKSELNLRNVDDWTEPSTAPSGVRTITTPSGDVIDVKDAA